MHEARGEVQVDAAQHGLGAVGEPEFVEVEPAVDASERARRFGVADLGLGVEHREIFSIAAPADCTWP